MAVIGSVCAGNASTNTGFDAQPACSYTSTACSVGTRIQDRYWTRIFAVLIAGIAAIWGGLLVHSKRRRHKAKIYTAPSNAHPEYFRPKSLTMPPLILYFGFAISAIILLEISCHTLPSASGPIHFPKLQSRNQVTKVIRTDISLLISILEATPTIDVLHPNVTCSDPSEQQYLLSTIFQE